MRLRRLALFAPLLLLTSCSSDATTPMPDTGHQIHSDIAATTFWVGEIYDPSLGVEGQNVASAWDDDWSANYGGCDGIGDPGKTCETEERTAGNGYFPTAMTPKENPFYLALPFDDVNNKIAFGLRDQIPWADEYTAEQLASDDVSLMKNRWVAVSGPGQVCYGQVEDAGPADYDDFGYVFGDDKPSQEFGIDLSPAMFSCVGLDLNDGSGQTSWSFIDRDDVPDGPWLQVETTTGINHG